MSGDDPLARIHAFVEPLVGERVWGASLGHGSFVTMEFGRPLPQEGRWVHGEYHVWIYLSAWRIATATEVLCAAEDDREWLAEVIPRLDGRTLEQLTIQRPAWDATFSFSGGMVLQVFPYSTSEDSRGWLVYGPSGTLALGPGNEWKIR
jgi:hypothetical protein